MWRNREVANFLTWLHDYNGQIPTEEVTTVETAGSRGRTGERACISTLKLGF